MTHLELAQALAVLPAKEVESIVEAASNFRAASALLTGLAPKKAKRGPKPATAPAKKRGRPRKVELERPSAFSGSLDRLKGIKEGGIKVRRPATAPVEDDAA